MHLCMQIQTGNTLQKSKEIIIKKSGSLQGKEEVVTERDWSLLLGN